MRSARSGVSVLVLLSVLLLLLFPPVVARSFAGTAALLEERKESAKDTFFGYELFAENGSPMMLIDPADGTILDANRAANSFYGYAELKGMNIGRINSLSPDEIQAEMERARRLNRNHFDFRHRLADGSLRNVKVYSYPVSIGDRKVLFSMIVDETDRVAAENALQQRNRLIGLLFVSAILLQSLALFMLTKAVARRKTTEKSLEEQLLFNRSLIETIPNPLLYKNREGRYLGCNDAYSELIGVSREAIVGKTAYDIWPKETADEYWKGDKALFASPGPQRYECTILDTEGNKRDVLLSKAPFFDKAGMLAGLVAVITDISGRKRMENALRESEKKLSALFAAMTEMVVLHDLVFDEHGNAVNYRIIDCNAAYERTTGIRAEHAVGRLATDVYGTETPPYLEQYSKVALTGEPYLFEVYFAPMDKYFSISAVSPGENRFATISADITAIKRAEQIVAAKNKELEQIVYVASHDLRSPLVNVDGYGRELEYSVEDLKKVLDAGDLPCEERNAAIRDLLPDMTDALKRIRNSTRQMDALLKGLLKMSRLGRAALKIGPVDMNSLIAQVVSSLQFQAGEAGADIDVSDLPPCRGDSVQLAQVFSNLLGNAVKYLDPERPGSITIEGGIENGRCVYCVADNGIGIAPEHQENIFQLFHRLDPSAGEGEGLGLTIVRQILGRLDGEIRVESKPGEGSRFFVTLPFAPAKETKSDGGI
jgi:PAS domain S-box-containing protein